VNETVELLAARAPKLRRAIRDAMNLQDVAVRDGDVLQMSGALPG
jgi:hypothetical protein